MAYEHAFKLHKRTQMHIIILYGVIATICHQKTYKGPKWSVWPKNKPDFVIQGLKSVQWKTF